jgi:LCP family protein required for cell wall assembly
MNPDPFAPTRPHYAVDVWAETKKTRWKRALLKATEIGCLVILGIFACIAIFGVAYMLFPGRTNLLVFGIDRAPEGTDASRSDTNILMTYHPIKPYLGMLSIPRDLWVPIPGIGENRINTAHFFAESANPGSGPQAVLDTVHENFGVQVRYYLRIRFDGIIDLIDALGGLDIELEEPMAGYKAGNHHLDGEQALAFVRDRSGTDDFFRMNQGQLFLKEVVEQLLSPVSWPKFPGVLRAWTKSIDTNLPLWQWPRMAIALLRVGLAGIDNRVISREMVTPTTTSDGAQILMPVWAEINPIIIEMFGG